MGYRLVTWATITVITAHTWRQQPFDILHQGFGDRCIPRRQHLMISASRGDGAWLERSPVTELTSRLIILLPILPV
ncbi:MAG: hypothetical protein HC910_17160 [Spirulinaceae cyanobacterium SM2_1_0]|nr:hypothetical protein [Spirulinaceae cyanobacterium SM2_1_0]